MDEMVAFWDYFNEGRLDDAIALCSTDFEYVDNQNGGTFDAAGYRDQMGQVLDAAPDRRVTVLRAFLGEDGAGVLETQWQGTLAGADDAVTTGMVVVFDTADGRITRQRLYYG